MNISENLKILRKKNNFSQRELAQAINVNQSFISQVERGTKTLSLIIAYDISEVLNCSLLKKEGIKQWRAKKKRQFPQKYKLSKVAICRNRLPTKILYQKIK